MILTRARQFRRGYTLTVVLITLILLFGLWTFVIRSTSSLLRIETTRSLRQARDQGAMNAMAQAVQLLQYGYPSDSQNTSSTVFTYYVTTTIPDASPITAASTAQVSYQVVYTWQNEVNQTWQIQITPVDPGSVDPAMTLPTGIAPPIAWPPGAGHR
jgi:hypothetical protein